ncbi:MAG: hypothetical protein HYU39_08935 [Thaumarchaeota archaeon]|nr:hypothetical protein [Nitrososphaerota archaeon]
MIRTARDVRSSLDIARKRRAYCRTSLIEQSIRDELQREFGAILSDDEKDRIVAMEKRFLKARSDAVKKARMNLLKQKERASVAWSLRNGSDPVEKRGEQENIAEIILRY